MFLIIFIAFIIRAWTLIDVPPLDIIKPSCVYKGVNYRTHLSVFAYQYLGRVDNCSRLCHIETLFDCEAYTWGGVGTHCILHGNITNYLVYPKKASIYSTYDRKCQDGKTGQRLTFCIFQSSNVSIGSFPEAKQIASIDREACETQCTLQVFSKCSSYAYDATISLYSGTNCLLFARELGNFTIPKGNFLLYENPCRV